MAQRTWRFAAPALAPVLALMLVGACGDDDDEQATLGEPLTSDSTTSMSASTGARAGAANRHVR